MHQASSEYSEDEPPSSTDLPHQGRDEVCDFCLYEGEGNFTSYGFPMPYRPNLNCSYRVQRVDEFDTCELELIFHKFDLRSSDGQEPSNDCEDDYLLVQDKRFCGTKWAGQTHSVSFPADMNELTFR